jgi:H+/Cl- antiporter ClcA
MLTTYKEIVYGAVFGFIALLLDTAMDAKSEGQGFLAEVGTHPAMMLYRLLFLFFGIFIGWLLWRDNQRERNVRKLMEDLRHFHQEYEAQAVVLHTSLQTLLTKDLHLSSDVESLIRSAYEKSRDLQGLAKQRPVV